jgi:hypothetical protein
MKDAKVDVDPRVKSNKKGGKESKSKIKQESADDNANGEKHTECAVEQSPAERPGTALQSKADKNGYKGNPGKCKQECTVGSLVWIRIKGFPWWPGLVVDESDVPENLKKVRPDLPDSFVVSGRAAPRLH